MDDGLEWYERDPLPYLEQRRLMEGGSFNPITELTPGPNQTRFVKTGSKLAVLKNVGLTHHYTVTSMRDRSGLFVVGRAEDGTHKGVEFCLDSSMGFCQSIGYKVLEKFPWE